MTALVTERLRLDPASEPDLERLRAHWDDPVVRQYLFDGERVSSETALKLLVASQRTFIDRGFGVWVVRFRGADRRSDPLIGTCGLVGAMTDPAELGWPGELIEIIFSLAPIAHGQGLATEAARAVLARGLGVCGLPRIGGAYDEPNTASRAVLERLGMTPFGSLPGVFGPIHYSMAERT